MKVIKADRVVHGESWDQTHIIEEELDPVDVAISELRAIKDKLDRAQLAYDQQQARVIDMLEAREEKSHLSTLDNGWQATVVYGETVTYDDAAILEALDTDEIAAVTDVKLNRKKLEAEVLAGHVDAHLVANHATVKPRKPFIRLTEHREQESEG
jgi:hypothetical protein